MYIRSILLLIILLYSTGILNEAEAAEQKPSLESESAILMDAKSGDIIFQKNSGEKMYPASITKIATAIYVIEHANLEDTVTVSANAANSEGSRVYLVEGEKMKLKQLLQGMLINSGNDAAMAVAEYVSGNQEQFSKDINAFIREKTGVTHTNFVNPSGLFHDNHYTTAEDMAKITTYAMKNDTFREIFQTQRLPWNGDSWETTLINHHRMLIGEIPYEGITGGKSGFVDESKHTLVTTAKRDSLDLIAVVMKADQKGMMYDDTMQLLDYGFSGFETEKYARGQSLSAEPGENAELPVDLFVTKKKNETLTEQINSSGKLNITGEDGRILKSLQLKKEEYPEQEPERPIQQAEAAEVEGEFNRYFPAVIMSLSLIGLLATSRFVKKLRNS